MKGEPGTIKPLVKTVRKQQDTISELTRYNKKLTEFALQAAMTGQAGPTMTSQQGKPVTIGERPRGVAYVKRDVRISLSGLDQTYSRIWMHRYLRSCKGTKDSMARRGFCSMSTFVVVLLYFTKASWPGMPTERRWQPRVWRGERKLAKYASHILSMRTLSLNFTVSISWCRCCSHSFPSLALLSAAWNGLSGSPRYVTWR